MWAICGHTQAYVATCGAHMRPICSKSDGLAQCAFESLWSAQGTAQAVVRTGPRGSQGGEEALRRSKRLRRGCSEDGTFRRFRPRRGSRGCRTASVDHADPKLPTRYALGAVAGQGTTRELAGNYGWAGHPSSAFRSPLRPRGPVSPLTTAQLQNSRLRAGCGCLGLFDVLVGQVRHATCSNAQTRGAVLTRVRLRSSCKGSKRPQCGRERHRGERCGACTAATCSPSWHRTVAS